MKVMPNSLVPAVILYLGIQVVLSQKPKQGKSVGIQKNDFPRNRCSVPCFPAIRDKQMSR